MPLEWTTMLLELPCPADGWERLEVTVNGQPHHPHLSRLGGCVRVLCPWPESAAGSYRIGWHHPLLGGGLRDVFVPPAKISTEGLKRLLADLDTRQPYALAAALQRGGALAGLSLRPPAETSVAAELARLRRLVIGEAEHPGLARVLVQIAARPHAVLAETRPLVPMHLARRPDAISLRQTLYRAREIDDEGIPIRIPDRRVEPTRDVYENRLIRLLADRAAWRLARLAPHVSGAARSELDETVHALRAARREAAFLSEVQPLARPPETITMVLLRRPEYRRALELWRELGAALDVHLEAEALDAPFEAVPALYELWTTLAATETATEVALQAGFRVTVERMVRRLPGTLLVQVLGDGRAAVEFVHERGARLEIAAQRPFGPGGRPLRSMSYEQRPDLTLEVKAPGRPAALLILDAKYKLEGGDLRPKKEDIDKMHAYRDAIVDTASGARVVHHAAILHPGAGAEFGTAISAIPAHPERTEAMHEQLATLVHRTLQDALCVGNGAEERPGFAGPIGIGSGPVPTAR